jgi:hypothetical protein
LSHWATAVSSFVQISIGVRYSGYEPAYRRAELAASQRAERADGYYRGIGLHEAIFDGAVTTKTSRCT